MILNKLENIYYPRLIDGYLTEWASRAEHKPLSLQEARQVGKPTAGRHHREQFKSYVDLPTLRNVSNEQVGSEYIQVNKEPQHFYRESKKTLLFPC